MDWIQFAVFLVTMLGMFFWLRTEANSDRREHAAVAAADRRDILQLIREIKEESKDFHGRLERQDAEFKAHLMHYHKE